MAKSDKWFWLAAGGAALAYLATRKDPESSLTRMNGLGAEPIPVSIAPDADLPAGLRDGTPGSYVISVRVVDVPLTDPLTPYLSTQPFQTAFSQAGIVGRVDSVKYVRNGEARSTNWAADALDDLFSSSGTGSGIKRGVSDRWFDVTITLGGNRQSGTGMGAVQLSAGAVVVILGAIAIGIAAFFPSARAAIIEGARSISRAIVTEPLKAAGEGVLILGLAAVAVIFLAKKSGASVKTSKFSF